MKTLNEQLQYTIHWLREMSFRASIDNQGHQAIISVESTKKAWLLEDFLERQDLDLISVDLMEA